MKRMVSAALFGLAMVMSVGSLVSGAAQEATPQAAEGTMAIPPIVWNLTAFVDQASGPSPVADPGRYQIQFGPDDTVFLKLDCNRGVGTYTMHGKSLTFGPIATTLMLCPEDSQADQLGQDLSYVTSFTIDEENGSDRLVLSLMADGGYLHFAPTLTGVTWEWEQFEGSDGTLVTPDDPANYAITFLPDGSVTAQVDCNRGRGSWTSDGVTIEIMVATTKMYCGDGSLDNDFLSTLDGASSFVIRDGKLALALPVDAGIATLSPVLVDESAAEATPAAAG